ncbi:helix-turn-helix domain-containing protein [Leucobacter massiliensis]|uniref:XRE family transcriptional regulator n=1 Tax=Leucobacter massiliensis TaxID=1686285 RepID=A0A2S9QN22_9MICO|nr:XRE family transcriptional regulator [Leucobacter massiliensis]PRI10967.1 XRE family transcriptional regulator [Leucobacter massiliensis]
MEELRSPGPRLRAARQERGWTLDELAGRAGMSVSTLSRLESGKRQASLELLLPLTRQLGIRVDDLLDSPERDPRVRRRPVTRDGMTIAPLTREASEVRAYKITYHPGAPERELQAHEGHEWLYVLSGRLQLDLGERQHLLGRGEAAEFDTTTPHRMRAAGTRAAEVVSIFNTVGERLHLRRTAAEEPETGPDAEQAAGRSD